jgi:hypothetical protein
MRVKRDEVCDSGHDGWVEERARKKVAGCDYVHRTNKPRGSEQSPLTNSLDFSVTYPDYFGGSMAFGYFAGLQLNTL